MRSAFRSGVGRLLLTLEIERSFSCYINPMLPSPLQGGKPLVGFALSFEAEYFQASIPGLSQ
jgi:hypothetical protein